jgi:radical SAM superfamily enzyme YgiQ (UPF0313 family)
VPPPTQRPSHPAVVLVYPRTGYDFGFGLAPPHSLLALAAYLRRQGIPNRVVIIDQRVEPGWEALLRRELAGRPLLVGISSMTGVQLKHALAVARLVRTHAPATPILFGGVHVSLLPEQSLRSEWIDLGIVGDGEVPLLALVRALDAGAADLSAIPGLAYREGGRVRVNPAAPPPDLAALPLDRFEGVDVERYVFKRAALLSGRELDLGETSRGCPRRCAYCYNTVFHAGRWRGLPAAAVIERIRHHVERYRLGSVWLRDDNFFVDVDRAAEVIDWVAGAGVGLYLPGITVQEFGRLPPATKRTLAGMKGALLRFGVESGSDAVLRAIDKGITADEVYRVNRECGALGVTPSYNFMIGFPGERREDVLATVGMMKRLRRENPRAQLNAVNLFTPYPGTALFERYRADHPGEVPARVEDWTTFHHLTVKRGRIGRAERRRYENVVEISYQLSDTFRSSLSPLLRRLHAPLRAWFALRWRLEAFAFAPEIWLMRRLKKALLKID